MSKFIDKLTRSYRNLSPAIGFKLSNQEEDTNPMLLLADLTNASQKTIKDTVGCGIDAAVVSEDKLDMANLKTLTKNPANLPVGLLLVDADTEKVDEFIKLGGDFAVFSPATPIDLLNKEGLGKILAIAPSMEPGIIRAVNALDLPVDSVLIEGDESIVTVERLLVYQFFAGLLDKPLLVKASSVITANELSNLYKAGVNGLILPKGYKLKAISELKELIAKLPKVSKKKGGTSALIPKISSETRVDVDDDDDDEDI